MDLNIAAADDGPLAGSPNLIFTTERDGSWPIHATWSSSAGGEHYRFSHAAPGDPAPVAVYRYLFTTLHGRPPAR